MVLSISVSNRSLSVSDFSRLTLLLFFLFYITFVLMQHDDSIGMLGGGINWQDKPNSGRTRLDQERDVC